MNLIETFNNEIFIATHDKITVIDPYKNQSRILQNHHQKDEINAIKMGKLGLQMVLNF